LNEIQVTAKAATTKGGKWFQRNRYTTNLFINGVATGIHVHHNRKDIAEVQEWLVDHAPQLLHEEGLYEEFFYMFSPEGDGLIPLPEVGQTIELTESIGQFGAGTKGKVIAVEPGNPDDDPDYLYPVTFAPDADNTLRVPLAYGEWAVSA
jgi:hypothetical protein